MRIALGIALLGVFQVGTAHAENLMDAYRQALRRDPVLKQAAAVSREGHAGIGIARAPLLPQLNVGAQLTNSNGTETGSTQLTGTTTGTSFLNPSANLGARSRSYDAGLNQVLFDLGDIQQLRASRATASADGETLMSARQDLIVRVATAYFTILTDLNQLKFDESNAVAYKKLLAQIKAQFKVGITARTVLADAEAQHDGAVSQVISDKHALVGARQALAQMTGRQPGTLATLTTNLPLNVPDPSNVKELIQEAVVSNPSLLAARDHVEAAQHAVGAARAARLPTLTASAQYERDASWSGSSNVNDAGMPVDLQQQLGFNSRTSGTAIGLVLTVPLFAGGGIHAQIQQAVAKRDQTNQVLVQDTRATVADVRNAFSAVETGIASVKADKRAVHSAKVALDSTEAGFRVGVDGIVDVVIARSTYLQSLSAYSQARHALVVSRLDLKFATGSLSVKDLEAVNTLLR